MKYERKETLLWFSSRSDRDETHPTMIFDNRTKLINYDFFSSIPNLKKNYIQNIFGFQWGNNRHFSDVGENVHRKISRFCFRNQKKCTAGILSILEKY